MKANSRNIKICPQCESPYTARSALSRKDNKTYICPKCGMREALEIAHVPKDAIQQMIEKIFKDED